MTTALADRLRHAVSVHAAVAPGSSHSDLRRPTSDSALHQILGGEWHDTAHGPVFVRDDWFPLDHQHGSHALGAALDGEAPAMALLLGAATAPDAARLAFFDIETTGLSGGTGTYVVIAGLGTYERVLPGEPLAFRMRQYFLADIAHERAMLAMLAADLDRFDGLVTYNGRSFDVPFVQTRLTLSRLRSSYDKLPHFDLLHAVRRLYKHRMPGCRLADAERRLLKLERPDDVPGWQIPSLYFDYLRAGRISPLRAVFRHNAEDVLSLAAILAVLTSLLSADDLPPEDAIAVARWHERAGDEPRAAKLYRGALPWLEGEPDWPWAATRHARLCKRVGDRAEAAALWQRLWSSGDAAAGLELAKHHEHRSRNIDGAIAVTQALLAAGGDAAALQHRLARLHRKAMRSA